MARGIVVNWTLSLQENKQTQELLIVGALSLLALVTRVYGIWEWPITGDEYFTIANFEDRSTGIIGSAYYALGLVSQAVFGPTKWSARLPAVVLGVLSIPAFYLMCRSMLDRKSATIGCIFIILSEWHLYHSQIARFYSGVFLFGTISYYLYYSSLKQESYSYLLLFFVSSLIAVSFHATSIFLVASCAAYSLLLVIYPQEKDSGLSRRVAKVHLVACILVVVPALPKFLGIAQSWGVGYSGVGADNLSVILGIVENMSVAISASAFLGLIYIYFGSKEKFRLFMMLSLVPLFVVFLFSIFTPPSKPRYMFYSIPIFFSLSASFCSGVESRVSSILGYELGAIFLISSMLLVGFISYYSGRSSLSVKDPVEFVERNYESGDKVVVFGYSLRYYLDDRIDVSLIKSKSVWKRGLVPVAKKEGRTWVIVDTYRTAPLRRDLEAWLFENASLRWRKEETRFDYTQRGYEVWLEDRK